MGRAYIFSKDRFPGLTLKFHFAALSGPRNQPFSSSTTTTPPRSDYHIAGGQSTRGDSVCSLMSVFLLPGPSAHRPCPSISLATSSPFPSPLLEPLSTLPSTSDMLAFLLQNLYNTLSLCVNFPKITHLNLHHSP